MAMERIKAGQWVALQRESYVRICQVTEKSDMAFGKDMLNLNSLLDQPVWGSYLMEETDGKNKRQKRYSLKPCKTEEFEESMVDFLVGDNIDAKDNRFIKDDGQSQRLSKEEIEGLQAEGASAKEIIGQLVENSATFDQKTSFAQEKYVSKKQKKYKKCLLVRPTTSRVVVQALTANHQNSQAKLLGLRLDSLSQIVSLSGVQAGAGPCTFLVFESGSQGLVVSTMMERLSAESDSHLIVLSPTKGTSKAVAIQAMNYPPALLSKVHYIGLSYFLEKAGKAGLLGKTESSNGENENSKRPLETSDEGPQAKKSYSSSEEEIMTLMDRLESNKAACLVVVGKENPVEVCNLLLPFVGLSRPVVIYSQFKEPLQEAYMKLKADKNVTALKLTEPWLRKYQFLPDRTHPEVLMSGSGGFILSGLTVETE